MKKFVIALMCFALMMQLADCGSARTPAPGQTTNGTTSTQPPNGKRSVDAQLEEIRQEGGWEQLVKDGDGGSH
jgi:hypothetical protein